MGVKRDRITPFRYISLAWWLRLVIPVFLRLEDV